MGISGRNLHSCLTSAKEICMSIKHKFCDVLDKLTKMVIALYEWTTWNFVADSDVINDQNLMTIWSHIAPAGHKWLFYVVMFLKMSLFERGHKKWKYHPRYKSKSLVHCRQASISLQFPSLFEMGHKKGTYIHIYMRTCMHVHTHTHTHIYIYIYITTVRSL